MTDEKMTGISLPPVTMTVIGTSNGLVQGTKATTPPDQPNIVVKIVPKFKALAARFAHAYVVMLVSLVGAGMTTNIIPAADFGHLLWKCMQLSLAAAGFEFFKSLVTITSQWAKDNPLLSGEV